MKLRPAVTLVQSMTSGSAVDLAQSLCACRSSGVAVSEKVDELHWTKYVSEAIAEKQFKKWARALSLQQPASATAEAHAAKGDRPSALAEQHQQDQQQREAAEAALQQEPPAAAPLEPLAWGLHRLTAQRAEEIQSNAIIRAVVDVLRSFRQEDEEQQESIAATIVAMTAALQDPVVTTGQEIRSELELLSTLAGVAQAGHVTDATAAAVHAAADRVVNLDSG